MGSNFLNLWPIAYIAEKILHNKSSRQIGGEGFLRGKSKSPSEECPCFGTCLPVNRLEILPCSTVLHPRAMLIMEDIL